MKSSVAAEFTLRMYQAEYHALGIPAEALVAVNRSLQFILQLNN